MGSETHVYDILIAFSVDASVGEEEIFDRKVLKYTREFIVCICADSCVITFGVKVLFLSYCCQEYFQVEDCTDNYFTELHKFEACAVFRLNHHSKSELVSC